MKDLILGQRIVEFRPITQAELELEGWEDSPHAKSTMVIVLDNGVKIYPSRDQEGNGPGALFGANGEEMLCFYA